MGNLPSNLPALLRDAGLTVVEIEGWETRGRPASTGGFDPVGVLNHHTGSRDEDGDFADDLAYANWLAKTGRSDLPAPLCQITLSHEGVVYVLAAGRANHAGTAKASGSVSGGDGNTLYIGIEWMLSGTQPIPVKMMAAGVILNAVLTEQVTKTSVQSISCHYQTSVTGKWDIGDPDGVLFNGRRVLDVDRFRAKVAEERKRLFHAREVVPEGTVLGLSWNLLAGRLVGVVRKELRTLIKTNDKPVFVSLQEARGYRAVIAFVATVLGYRVFQPKDDGPKPPGVHIREAGSTALLVRRRGIKVQNSGVIRGRETWVGPNKGLVHEGRVFPWAVAWVDGAWTLLVAVHMPTGKYRTSNKAAWDEMQTKIETLARRLDLPFIVIGDMNDPWDAPGPRSFGALAKRMGGQIIHHEPPIDYALIGGLKATVTKAAQRGSDHFAIRIHKKG